MHFFISTHLQVNPSILNLWLILINHSQHDSFFNRFTALIYIHIQYIHIYLFIYLLLSKSVGASNCWLPTFFKISSFVFSTRIQINTGLVHTTWQCVINDIIIIFGWSIPLMTIGSMFSYVPFCFSLKPYFHFRHNYLFICKHCVFLAVLAQSDDN